MAAPEIRPHRPVDPRASFPSWSSQTPPTVSPAPVTTVQAPAADWHLRWENVERTRRWYRPYPDACFVADSMYPLADNIAAIARVLSL
jgi:hypothetical protein